MNIGIDPNMAWPAADPAPSRAGAPVSLQERFAALQSEQTPPTEEHDPEECEMDHEGLEEGECEVYQQMMKQWAMGTFIEKLLFGDEEETGITPLVSEL